MGTRISGGGGIPYNQLREIAEGADDGGGAVATVAGIAPDEGGNVAFTYADIGPILVSDLGFDPETQAEWDAAAATTAQNLALKADKSDTYGKAAVNGLLAAAGKFKGQFTGGVSYAQGDVVLQGGDLYQAAVDVPAGGTISLVGTASNFSTTNAVTGGVALPAGTQAGDLLVLVVAGRAIPTPTTPEKPGGMTRADQAYGTFGTFPNQIEVWTKTLTAADVVANVVTQRAAGLQQCGYHVRVYRGAAGVAPGGKSIQTAALPSSGALVPAAFIANAGERVLTAWSTNSIDGAGSDSTGTLGAGTQDAVTTTSTGFAAAGLVTTDTPITVTGPTAATPTWSPNNRSNRAYGEIGVRVLPGAFNSVQWTRAVDTTTLAGRISKVEPKRVAVANANYTADGTETVIAYTSLAGTRSVVLPAPSAVPAGRSIVVKDESGAASAASYIDIARASSGHTIDGAASNLSMNVPRGAITLYSDGASGWHTARDPLTIPPVRATAVKATASLAVNASEQGTVALGKSFRILKMATDRPARVRLYATAAQGAADASRAVGTDPSGDHGLILEYVSATGALSKALAPQVDGSNLEAPPSSAISYVITNLDSAPGAVSTTFTYIATEA